MARILLAIVVLFGLSVVGCQREKEPTPKGTQGTGETYKSPATQPDVSVTPPPTTPEPTEPQPQREGGMRPEGGSTEEQSAEGGPATAPAGGETGGGEGSPGE